jgi:hypothetical protein
MFNLDFNLVSGVVMLLCILLVLLISFTRYHFKIRITDNINQEDKDNKQNT